MHLSPFGGNDSKANAFDSESVPDLTPYWDLGFVRGQQEFVLSAKTGNRHHRFNLAQGIALQHFMGRYTVAQVQERVSEQLGDTVSPALVVELLYQLVELEILEGSRESGVVSRETEGQSLLERTKQGSQEAASHPELSPSSSPIPHSLLPTPSPSLKPNLQWIAHPDGYWILRNPESVTFLQVDERSQRAISLLGQLPMEEIVSKTGVGIPQLRYLLQLLAATGMLVGTKPSKPQKGKFNPLQLLFFKVPLFNPDSWLSRHVKALGWIWTTPMAFLVCFFLAWSALLGLKLWGEIVFTGQQLWATSGVSLILPFVLLMMLVVSLHELGHAFTLKHYGGIVPEIGLLFMCLMPGCYTNTTDSYCLVRKRQRTLVVGAGVLVQLLIWAVGLWLWNLSNPDTWLHGTSYLLMVAALLTVAINLNPLSKFDGYYLAVALSGINNLRGRSFQLYGRWLRFQGSRESRRDVMVMAAYAPLSLAYLLLVFGHLLLLLGDWVLTHIPTIAGFLLLIWAVYFYYPRSNSLKV